MKLAIGVIIVGSLYWDDQPHRKKWRNDRLQMGKAIGAKLPIRYGRRSQSRGNTYTMVFSNGHQLGQAKAVPCARSVSCLEELIDEAECLWAAEQPSNQNPDKKKRLSEKWGCIALLAHPSFQKTPGQELLRQLLDGWAKRVSLEGNYDDKNYNEPDGRCLVDNRGILQIPWPDRTDGSGPLPFDIVLATATTPTPDSETQDYHSASAVAQAWKSDKNGHDKYFWRNRQHGIHTFQDEEIAKQLRAE